MLTILSSDLPSSVLANFKDTWRCRSLRKLADAWRAAEVPCEMLAKKTGNLKWLECPLWVKGSHFAPVSPMSALRQERTFCSLK
jgi:hypothetical protein